MIYLGKIYCELYWLNAENIFSTALQSDRNLLNKLAQLGFHFHGNYSAEFVLSYLVSTTLLRFLIAVRLST